MIYSERKTNNGTRYLVVAEKYDASRCVGRVYYDNDDDFPLIERIYGNSNMVTTATAVWIEYKQKVQKEIAQRMLDKTNAQ